MNELEEQRLLYKLFVFAFMNYDMDFNGHSYLVRNEGVSMRKIFELFPEDEATETLYYTYPYSEGLSGIYSTVVNRIIERDE